MSTDRPPTKLTFNAVPRAMKALELAAEHNGLNRTDTMNRAVQVYAAITGMGLWSAIRVLLHERATVRRFAASLVDCPDCDAEPMTYADLNEHLRARHGDS